MVHLTRKLYFSAAHRLRAEGMTEEQNRRVFGECARLHGHNYVLEVTFSGEPDSRTGMIIHLSDLDAIVRDRVIRELDHRNLDEDVAEFKTVPSTVEMLARYAWKRLEGAVPGASLHRVRIWEDPESFADYYGEA